MFLNYKSEKGETVQVVPKAFKPLSYSDIVKENGYKIEFIAKDGSVKVNGKKVNGNVSFSTNIDFKHPVQIYALSEGGWLPLPFINSSNILIDQNVLITINAILKDVNKQVYHDRDWWMQFINRKDLTINVFLCAFEGNRQRLPSLEEFIQSVDDASREVSKYFPNAQLTKYKPENFQAIYSTVSAVAPRHQREMTFLKKVAPLVSHSNSEKELGKSMFSILHEANDFHLTKGSLAVIAVLSCLYEDLSGAVFQAARKIIKPKKDDYTTEDAYNALSDLRHVEFFTLSQSVLKDRGSLCTCDRGLAAFWCGLQPMKSIWKNGKFTLTYTLDKHLFPRMPDDKFKELSEIFSG